MCLYVSFLETVPLSTNLETQLSKTTASYNQQLTENPYDEDLWLQYIDFQVFPSIGEFYCDFNTNRSNYRIFIRF